MRKSCRWAGLRTLVLALGTVALAAANGRADAIMSYDTSGQIDSAGVVGAGIISLIPVTNGSFNAPSQFSLGNFQVAALPGTDTTTYTNTPFHITYLVNTVNANVPNPNQTPIQISGVLNGSITGGDQSSVRATFDPISNPTFLAGNFSNTLSIPDNPISLVPHTTNGGQTSGQAFLDTKAVVNSPEPSSIALFVTALAGLGVRHRARSRRAA